MSYWLNLLPALLTFLDTACLLFGPLAQSFKAGRVPVCHTGSAACGRLPAGLRTEVGTEGQIQWIRGVRVQSYPHSPAHG